MIDIVGRGIRKIFNQQWERRFPMPDYEIDAVKKEVAVRLYGNIHYSGKLQIIAGNIADSS